MVHAPLILVHLKAPREGEKGILTGVFSTLTGGRDPVYAEGLCSCNAGKSDKTVLMIIKNTVTERDSGDICMLFWIHLLAGLSNLKVLNICKVIM